MPRRVSLSDTGEMIESVKGRKSGGRRFLENLLGEAGRIGTGIAGAELMDHYMGDEAPTSQHACLLRNQTDQNQAWTWDPVTQQCVPSPRIG
jgi:hypothetical protein